MAAKKRAAEVLHFLHKLEQLDLMTVANLLNLRWLLQEVTTVIHYHDVHLLELRSKESKAKGYRAVHTAPPTNKITFLLTRLPKAPPR